jgi:hypothetical protein
MGHHLPVRMLAWLPRRTWIVLALVVVALLGWLVVYLHGPNDHGDITLYHRYALAFWTGPRPLRSLPAEYPLLSVIPFSLTLLPPLPDTVTVFALWMLVLLVAGLAAMARRESPRVAEVCAVYLAVGGFATLLGRYDLVPAAITVAAYWTARERRFTLAYALVAAGTLLKLYPGLLLPLVALEQYRALGRDPLRSLPPWPVLAGVALCGGLVASGFAAARLLDPADWLGPLAYNAHRPIQIESVPATLLWASGLAGFRVSPNRSFHSYNLVGPLAQPIGLAAEVAMVLGLLWVYWRTAAGRLDLGRGMAACLLVVICTGRVLSPQYLAWFLPLVAIVERDWDVAWLLVGAATTLVFPFAYREVHPVGSGPPPEFPLPLLGAIALRNVLLVAAAVRFLRRPGARSEAEPRRLSRAPVA